MIANTAGHNLNLEVVIAQFGVQFRARDDHRGRQHSDGLGLLRLLAKGPVSLFQGSLHASGAQQQLDHVRAVQAGAELSGGKETGQLVLALADVVTEQPLTAGRTGVVALRVPCDPLILGDEQRQQWLLSFGCPDAQGLVPGRREQIPAVRRGSDGADLSGVTN